MVELHETIQEGLVREVREEVGILVNSEALTGIYKNMRQGVVALVFRCRVADGTPHAANEVTEVAWLTAGQLRERMEEAYAVWLLDALEPGPPTIRAHDGLTLLPA